MTTQNLYNLPKLHQVFGWYNLSLHVFFLFQMANKGRKYSLRLEKDTERANLQITKEILGLTPFVEHIKY